MNAAYNIQATTPTKSTQNATFTQSVPLPLEPRHKSSPSVPEPYRFSPSSVRSRRYSTPHDPLRIYGSFGDAYPSQMTSVEPSLNSGGKEAVHVHSTVSSE